MTYRLFFLFRGSVIFWIEKFLPSWKWSETHLVPYDLYSFLPWYMCILHIHTYTIIYYTYVHIAYWYGLIWIWQFYLWQQRYVSYPFNYFREHIFLCKKNGSKDFQFEKKYIYSILKWENIVGVILASFQKNLTRMCETVDTYHFRKVDGTYVVQFLLLYPR